MTCHHGHGLSIGGVRQGTIRNVTFENITATGGMSQGIYSTGGLRIKSYPNGSGSVSNIMYRNIVLDPPRRYISIGCQGWGAENVPRGRGDP